MAKFLKTLLLAVVVVAGVWLLLNKDQIRQPEDVVALAQQKLAVVGDRVDEITGRSWSTSGQSARAVELRTAPIASPRTGVTPSAQLASTRRERRSIRIASFCLDGPRSSPRAAVADLRLAELCHQYDVIALQGIREPQVAIGIVQGMNAAEKQTTDQALRGEYRLLMDSQSTTDLSGLAIIYDARAVELDDQHWYVVRDPDDVLVHEPMVAWFRARGVAANRAFTFSLANLEFDARRPDRELSYLTELFRAVRADGRGEDDVIIAGTFHSGDRGLAPSQQKLGLGWAISNKPTDTNQTAQVSNIVFQSAATVEFARQSGVFDFMRHFNLRLADAMQISSHLPVWAEFNLEEGDATPIVAKAPHSAPQPVR